MIPEFAPPIARRALRQFAGETHQFKRMRPCFYSPIQCLMKRGGSEDSSGEESAPPAKTNE
jgi:hypothetical protein